MRRLAGIIAVLGAALLLEGRALAQVATSPDAMATKMQACAGCHGPEGWGTDNDYFPRLAGKPAGYLFNQLLAFKEGRRKYPPMNFLLEYQSDDYLHAMAAYFADQRPPSPSVTPPTASPAVLALGQTLVARGDPARGIPACSACHGPKLTGMEPAIPGLVGLRPSYISAQLGAFRYGTRTAAAPDCMQIIAASLTEGDVAAVAAWLASQPVPPEVSPVPKGTLSMPLACGSEQSLPSVISMPRAAVGDQSPIAKGEYLARAGDCIACHTNPGDALFAGGFAMPTPFGTLYSTNITPDRETGIGIWEAGQFYRAMHTGRFPDGGLMYPAMPFASYTKVTRVDSDAIFAYLRSVPPVHQPNRLNDLRFPFNNRSLILGWRTLFFREGEYKPDPTKSAEWNRGAYLVQGLGHCGMCHTPINKLGGNSQSQAFEGGLIPMQNWNAPSLTSNKEAGLGEWSIDDIIDLLHTGVSQRAAVFGPMAEVTYDSLQYLNDADVRAMAVYLKDLGQGPPLRAEVTAMPHPERNLLLHFGRIIYERHCASCHGSDGRGLPREYPALAGNPSIQMKFAVNAIRMTLNGGFPPATQGNPRPYGMPPFAQTLSDDEVAAVVTYIRAAWGNRGAAVSAREANSLRTAPLD
jgi:cytochrome c553